MSKDIHLPTRAVDQLQDGYKTSASAMPTSRAYKSSNENDQWIDHETISLVQQIFLLQTQEPPRMVVFAGIDHGSGCSRICATVAEILAKTSRRPVCLVDANFRRPALEEMFGTPPAPGLAEALMQHGPISSFARPVAGKNLYLLSAGKLTIGSPDLFSVDGLQERLHELLQNCDFVIIDTPPLGKYLDALVLGQHSAGLVLVLEADCTRRESALNAVSSLRSAKVPILAAVLNKRTFPLPEKLGKFL